MTPRDPLELLQLRIRSFYAANPAARSVLIDRLHRLSAPVLEEREQLLSKLERGNQILTEENPYVPGSFSPENTDPKHQRKKDQWIHWLSRLQQIEDVLASFPGSDGSPCGYGSSGAPSAKPPIKRLVTSLAQPP